MVVGTTDGPSGSIALDKTFNEIDTAFNSNKCILINHSGYVRNVYYDGTIYTVQTDDGTFFNASSASEYPSYMPK